MALNLNKNEQPLTEQYIRAMHAQFTSHQKDTEALTSDGKIISVNLEKGTYKSQPNNPRRPDGSLHFYCPPEHVQGEMNNLIEWYRNSETDFAPEVRAAWLHHRFTQIHPFQDGNGRVARALATLVFLKAHIFPLVLRNSDRREYILALETADSGNLLPLINLFAKRQVNAILNALTLQQQIKPVKQTEKIISSAVEILKNNHSSKKEEIRNVYDFADILFEAAKTQFDATTTNLNTELKLLKLQSQQQYYCSLTSATNDSSHKNLFYKQVVDIANEFNYRANLTQYNAWACIEIRTSEVFEIVISIHSFGYNGIGIMAALALTTRRLLSGEDISEPVEVRPACTEHFQFNYAEPFESTKSRFENWLADSLVIALEDWKKQISI